MVDMKTAAAARAAQNAMATVTLAAHEICSFAYPDPVEQKEFLERASRDWCNSDYHVYMMMYVSQSTEGESDSRYTVVGRKPLAVY